MNNKPITGPPSIIDHIQYIRYLDTDDIERLLELRPGGELPDSVSPNDQSSLFVDTMTDVLHKRSELHRFVLRASGLYFPDETSRQIHRLRVRVSPSAATRGFAVARFPKIIRPSDEYVAVAELTVADGQPGDPRKWCPA